ncbi:LysR family transcriptional regulator [Novosphingobium pokkalii]|uniref:LysR family transcriptional regulator n=1 Tax=Novosphingobium pokkalii TaxID=1770194 RepID=UPI0036261EE7
MDFDERHLRAFLAVAETGSLGRAAAVVNLTQPSLSRMIQAMEQRLGHKLFERQSKGMALTAAGEILLPHARLLAFEMRAARDQLDALRGCAGAWCGWARWPPRCARWWRRRWGRCWRGTRN